MWITGDTTCQQSIQSRQSDDTYDIGSRTRCSDSQYSIIGCRMIGLQILPSLFWTLMLLVTIYDGEDEIVVIVFSAIFLAIGVLFTVLGIKGISTISAVSFCCRYFDSDPDGIIEMDSILRKKGRGTGSAFEKTIIRAVEKDYFLKLTYDHVADVLDRVID